MGEQAMAPQDPNMTTLELPDGRALTDADIAQAATTYSGGLLRSTTSVAEHTTPQTDPLARRLAPDEENLKEWLTLEIDWEWPDATSCKAQSRVCLRKADAHDVGTKGDGKADMAMQGVRHDFQCAELVHNLRAMAEKATEWNAPVHVSKIDFAKACVNVRHSAIRRAMLRRGVPPPVVATYIRDMRRSGVVFACKMADATVGLRRGCSLSPLVVRWVVEDVVSVARERWQMMGAGLDLDGHVLDCLAWRRRHVGVRVQCRIASRHDRGPPAGCVGGSWPRVALRKVHQGCDFPGGPQTQADTTESS